jgi:plastocyanin
VICGSVDGAEAPILDTRGQQMAQTYKVDIQNMQFKPTSLTIAKGDTVEWTNRMGFAHTVKPDNDEFPGSGPISPNKSFSHVFDSGGTVAYHCEIHPQMKGKVIVN